MRPCSAMVMENKVIGNSQGQVTSQGPSDLDMAAMYLFDEFRFIIQQASEPPAEFLTSSGETIQGVPLRDISGEVVGVMEKGGDVVLMPDGQRIGAEEIAKAAAEPPPPPPPLKHEEKSASGKEICEAEDIFPAEGLPVTEQEVCAAPEPPAYDAETALAGGPMQSFDYFTGAEELPMSIPDAAETAVAQTENSAARFASAPKKKAKPAPPKTGEPDSPGSLPEPLPPPKTEASAPEPRMAGSQEPEEKPASSASESKKEEPVSVVLSSVEPEQSEEPNAATPPKAAVVEPKQQVVSSVPAPEEASQYSAAVFADESEGFPKGQIVGAGFGPDAATSGSERSEEAGRSAEISLDGALLFFANMSTRENAAPEVAGGEARAKSEMAGSAGRSVSSTLGGIRSSAEKILAAAVGEISEASDRIFTSLASSFKGKPGLAAKLGAFAIFGHDAFESETEKDTAQYGGMPNFGALAFMLANGLSFSPGEMKQSDRVESAHARSNSGDHQGEERGKDGNQETTEFDSPDEFDEEEEELFALA